MGQVRAIEVTDDELIMAFCDSPKRRALLPSTCTSREEAGLLQSIGSPQSVIAVFLPTST
jgi:hypothetical protein